MDAKIHYRGSYNPAPDRCWTCSKPLVKIWIEDFYFEDGTPDMTKWNWFLKYFGNQYGEKVIFFEESAEDVFCSNKNYGDETVQAKWQLPIPVLDWLLEKGLIKNSVIKMQIDLRKQQEAKNGKVLDKIEVDDIKSLPKGVPDTEISKDKVMELLGQQDPNSEFKVTR